MTNTRKCCKIPPTFILVIGLGVFLGVYTGLKYMETELFTLRKQNFGNLTGILTNNSPVALPSTEYIIQQRRLHVKDICENQKIPRSNTDSRNRFLIYKPLSVSLCYIPKAGCTFWKRVFIGLKKNMSDIFQITKMQAHYSRIDTLANMLTPDAAYNFLYKSSRIVFVRNPYSRLYSAYEDKLFLGDFFFPFGTQIVKSIRKTATEESLRCGHDVTFEEFIRYVLLVSQQPYRYGGDEHWVPMTNLCHPCDFDFDIIGKQETFAKDRDYIFKQVGINIVSERAMSPAELARDAMKQTIDMIWDKRSGCLSVVQSIERMWISYQRQGYIHNSIEFPRRRTSNNITKDGFLSLAMEAYHSRPMTSQERKEQRKLALRKAYSSLSTKTVEAIQQTFLLDFKLFQYEIEPKELFK